MRRFPGSSPCLLSLCGNNLFVIIPPKVWCSQGVVGVFLCFFFILILYCYSITVVCLFSPSLHPTPAEPPSLPHLHPPPWFCPCVLYSSSCNPLSSLSRPHSPQPLVRLFLTSMSLVIFCFLFSSIYYVPIKGEVIVLEAGSPRSTCQQGWFLLSPLYMVFLLWTRIPGVPSSCKGISHIGSGQSMWPLLP